MPNITLFKGYFGGQDRTLVRDPFRVPSAIKRALLTIECRQLAGIAPLEARFECAETEGTCWTALKVDLGVNAVGYRVEQIEPNAIPSELDIRVTVIERSLGRAWVHGVLPYE